MRRNMSRLLSEEDVFAEAGRQRHKLRIAHGLAVVQLCGDDVKKLVESKEAMETQVEKLKEEIEKLQEKGKKKTGKSLMRASERLVNKRDSLKEQEKNLKMMKGQPVALKKFLEEVVLPGCVLCPP